MKKKLLLIILLLVVLVFLGVVFRSPTIKNDIKTNNTEVIIQNESLVVDGSYQVKTLNIDDPYVTFDVKYPYFNKADGNFNSSIENLLKVKIEDHKKTSREYWQARYDTQEKGENFPIVPATEADKLYFSSDIIIVQSNPFFISFVLKISGFSGGAHGYETNFSFNYDVENQKVIKLSDIFPNDPQYLNYLSLGSRMYLENKFAAEADANSDENSDPKALEEYAKNMISMVESGTEPKEENFSVFTFTPGKVKIYFAQYQVGPYVEGMPEVEMLME
jgi:hypothetical protein